MNKEKASMPHGKPNEDEQLLKGCKQQDASCQRRLFEKYYGPMLSICLRYANNKEDARDILQDGFAKVFLNIHKYEPKVPLFHWIRTIIVNTAIDKYRKDARMPVEVSMYDHYKQQNLDKEIMAEFNAEDLLKLVQQLPDGARNVFNMFVIEGYSHKEIASMLGCSAATSRSQLDYARKQLRKKINKLGESEQK